MAVPLIIAGALIGAAGKVKAGADAKEAADFDSSIKSAQGQEALQEGQENERRARLQSRYQIGGERAAIGASGVKAEGSPLEVLQNSVSNAELDALTIRHQSQLKAWSYEQGAAASQMEGRAAQSQAGFGAAGSLLSGGASLAKNA